MEDKTRVIEIVRGARVGQTMDDVITAAATACEVPIADIMSPDRSKQVALARHLCMYMGRHVLASPPTLASIGISLGGRDHTTVIYGVLRIDRGVNLGNREILSLLESAIAVLKESSSSTDWKLEVVDPDLYGEEGSAGYPALKVTYVRPDGTEFVGVQPMHPNQHAGVM